MICVCLGNDVSRRDSCQSDWFAYDSDVRAGEGGRQDVRAGARLRCNSISVASGVGVWTNFCEWCLLENVQV